MADAPGVYFTESKGGAGDSRVYIRGFYQENSATLINGVPVMIWKMVECIGPTGME
ncbi:hypothetical protein Ct9H90mP29_22730 [bacterium]|nr:MAG: hypothetical protein Ct9H90mP29_22730 [bacterium]